MLFRNRLLMIYRCGDRLSEASMRYLKWFYNIIYRIPMNVVKSSDFLERSKKNQLISGNMCNYIMIFLLSSISGENEDSELWNRLFEINQKIPIISFYRAAYALKGNHHAKTLFNIDPVSEEEGYVRRVSLNDEILFHGIKYPSIENPNSSYSSKDDIDHFIIIKPLKNEDFKPLMFYDNEIVAAQSGLNIFIGQKGVAIPREDKALEFDRPIYFLRLLDNLLKKSPAGYLRFKLSKWPVVLRIDDPPMTWQYAIKKDKILTPMEYNNIIDILMKRGAKMTCFITPAYVSKDGEAKSWFETNFNDAKVIIRTLKDGMQKGVLEIGCHGLTHLTIGYKPPSTIKQMLKKFGLFGYNIAREFYDSKQRKEIPYELQKSQLTKAIALIEELFYFKPKAFSPPTHAWDDSTEKAVLELGISYFSADMNFHVYPEGHDFRKNPSPLGEAVYSDKLLYVSATLLSRYGMFRKTLKLFNELGIPLVWLQHNYQSSWFTPEILECFFEDIEPFQDKTYLTISELGEMLKKYRRVKSHTTFEDGQAKCKIETEIPLTIMAYFKGKIQEKEIPIGSHTLDLEL